MFIHSALRGIVDAPVSVQSGLHLHGVRLLPTDSNQALLGQ